MAPKILATIRLLSTDGGTRHTHQLSREWAWPVTPTLGIRFCTPPLPQTGERLLLEVQRIMIHLETDQVEALLVPLLAPVPRQTVSLGSPAVDEEPPVGLLHDPVLLKEGAELWIAHLQSTTGFAPSA